MNESGSGGADAEEVERDGTTQAPAVPPAGSDADGPTDAAELAEASAEVNDVLIVEAASSADLG